MQTRLRAFYQHTPAFVLVEVGCRAGGFAQNFTSSTCPGCEAGLLETKERKLLLVHPITRAYEAEVEPLCAQAAKYDDNTECYNAIPDAMMDPVEMLSASGCVVPQPLLNMLDISDLIVTKTAPEDFVVLSLSMGVSDMYILRHLIARGVLCTHIDVLVTSIASVDTTQAQEFEWTLRFITSHPECPKFVVN